MIDDEFEWDDAKARQNYAKHGVTFETAREVLREPFLYDWPDERHDYDEERYAAVGMAKGRLYYVAFTVRNERIRIISARGAEPHEQRQYHEERT